MNLRCKISILGMLFGCCLIPAGVVAQTVAYTNATLETMGESGQIENGTLVVRDDKIIAVGTDVEVPDDARLVSMAGKTIMPGLIDPYFVYQRNSGGGTRTVTFGGRTFTVGGSSTFSAGPFVRIGEYFYPYKFDFRPAMRSGITTGNLVSDSQGLSALANISEHRGPEMIFEPDGVLFAKITNQTNGLDVIRKPLETKSKPAKKTSTSATDKLSEKSDAEKIKELWNSVRDGKSPLFVNLNNQASVEYVLQIVKKHENVRLVLIATGPNLYESLETIKQNKNVTVVLQPGIDRVPNTTDLMNVSQMLAAKEIPFAISMSLAGRQFNDSQDDPMFPLAMLVRTGLDRKMAMEAVTSKPAKLLGIEKTHGSLEANKQANFLVFDGDPLTTGTRLEQVFLNGDKSYEN